MTDFSNIIFSALAIEAEVKRLAHRIAQDQSGKPLEVIGLMHGALFFMADLIRHLDFELGVHTLRLKSYDGNAQGRVRFELDFDPKDKRILIVDDILDSGNSLKTLSAELKRQGAAEVLTCCLLDKGLSDVKLTYPGLTCPDLWVVGYGMDYNGFYRNLPFVAELPEHLK